PNPPRIGLCPPHIIPRRPPQRDHLIRIHIALRRAPLLRCPPLHLNEHQRLALARNQIDLSATLRRTPVPRHHHHPLRPQIPVRQILPMPPRVTVTAESQPVGQPVQRFERAQTRTPSTFRAPRSRDSAPKTAGTAE